MLGKSSISTFKYDGLPVLLIGNPFLGAGSFKKVINSYEFIHSSDENAGFVGRKKVTRW